MADFRALKPFILKWEGGFVNDPYDRGGATNMGVTYKTWVTYCMGEGIRPTVDGLRNITDTQWDTIFKRLYWDRWKADKIEDQSIANILVDWIWASGTYGITIPQSVLKVVPDGIVGVKTLSAINGHIDKKVLFDMLQKRRIKFVRDIVRKDPTQKRFINGWENRILSLKY